MRVGLLSLSFLVLSSALSGQNRPSYTPVAPARAVHAGLAAQLRQVGDWLAEKDFASVAQAAQGLEVFGVLAGYHGDQAWQADSSALATLARQLSAAARQKDADMCKELIEAGDRRLHSMGKTIPDAKAPAGVPRVASTKVWMLLADGTYVDAKSARSPAQLEQLAYLLAEEANAMAHLRPGWEKLAYSVRDAALDVVRENQSGGLDAGKKALKGVYQRCEACHQQNKR